MNNNIICRADIKAKPRKRSYVLIAFTVLVNILLLLLVRSGSSEKEYEEAIKLPMFLLIGQILFYSLYIATNISYSKQCKLELTDKIVNGVVKKSRINHRLNIPLDKIDNIEIIDLNSFFTGKTIAIRSASGLVKFPWVQNAEEFVNATLAKSEEYKQQVKEENKSLVKAVTESAAAAAKPEASQTLASKIKELKDLLDNDLISKEEYEAKRRDLLDKM